MSFATIYVHISDASEHLVIDKQNPIHELLSIDRYFMARIELYPVKLNGKECSVRTLQ